MAFLPHVIGTLVFAVAAVMLAGTLLMPWAIENQTGEPGPEVNVSFLKLFAGIAAGGFALRIFGRWIY